MTQFDTKLGSTPARPADRLPNLTLKAAKAQMTKVYSPAAIAELLELTARVLHSRGFAADLFPAQWMALRYFARAPRELCTSSELARFQGLANGPVSRTVRILIQKGLLKKADEQPKGRAEVLEVTAEGQELLKQDPTTELVSLMADLSEDDRETVGRSLETVIDRLSAATRQA